MKYFKMLTFVCSALGSTHVPSALVCVSKKSSSGAMGRPVSRAYTTKIKNKVKKYSIIYHIF